MGQASQTDSPKPRPWRPSGSPLLPPQPAITPPPAWLTLCSGPETQKLVSRPHTCQHILLEEPSPCARMCPLPATSITSPGQVQGPVHRSSASALPPSFPLGAPNKASGPVSTTLRPRAPEARWGPPRAVPPRPPDLVPQKAQPPPCSEGTPAPSQASTCPPSVQAGPPRRPRGPPSLPPVSARVYRAPMLNGTPKQPLICTWGYGFS